MIFEMRTYRLKPGTLPRFVGIYETTGVGIITRYARLIGCWQTEVGTLNSVVFVWAYNDFAHRTEQRAKLAGDPDWQAFVPQIVPFLDHQESCFLNALPFSPVR